MQRCSQALLARLPRRGGRETCRRGLSSESPPPQEPGLNPDEPPPPPPNVFAAVGAMGAGAIGAVFIAAVGVWGVFKMAFYVASETGRTINADKALGSSGASAPAAAVDQQQQQPGDVKAASPLESRWQGALPRFASAAARVPATHLGRTHEWSGSYQSA